MQEIVTLAMSKESISSAIPFVMAMICLLALSLMWRGMVWGYRAMRKWRMQNKMRKFHDGEIFRMEFSSVLGSPCDLDSRIYKLEKALGIQPPAHSSLQTIGRVLVAMEDEPSESQDAQPAEAHPEMELAETDPHWRMLQKMENALVRAEQREKDKLDREERMTMRIADMMQSGLHAVLMAIRQDKNHSQASEPEPCFCEREARPPKQGRRQRKVNPHIHPVQPPSPPSSDFSLTKEQQLALYEVAARFNAIADPTEGDLFGVICELRKILEGEGKEQDN